MKKKFKKTENTTPKYMLLIFQISLQIYVLCINKDIDHAVGQSLCLVISFLYTQAKNWRSMDEMGSSNTHTAVTGRSASYNVTTTLPPKHSACE